MLRQVELCLAGVAKVQVEVEQHVVAEMVVELVVEVVVALVALRAVASLVLVVLAVSENRIESTTTVFSFYLEQYYLHYRLLCWLLNWLLCRLLNFFLILLKKT